MPNDYGLDKLSTDELLGVSKTPAAPSAPPTPSSAPVTDYGLDKLPANELLGTPSDLAAESAKAAALFRLFKKRQTASIDIIWDLDAIADALHIDPGGAWHVHQLVA